MKNRQKQRVDSGKKTPLTEDQALQQSVMKAVASIGVPKVTVARVVDWLRSQPQVGHVPSKTTVRALLIRKFGM
jgi:hypothetical protein